MSHNTESILKAHSQLGGFGSVKGRDGVAKLRTQYQWEQYAKSRRVQHTAIEPRPVAVEGRDQSEDRATPLVLVQYHEGAEYPWEVVAAADRRVLARSHNAESAVRIASGIEHNPSVYRALVV